MKAVVVLGGKLRGKDWLRSRLQDQLIIGADSGCDHLYELGIVPDFVLGDLDSISATALSWIKHHGIEPTVFLTRKNATDSELAIDFALSKGADELLVLSGFEHVRPDHNLGTLLHLASLLEQQQLQQAWLSNGETVATALPAGKKLHFELAALPEVTGRRIVSLLALSEEVKGINYTGLDYPLTDFTLPFGSSRGLSNYPAAGVSEFSMECESGLALLYITPDD